MNLCKKLIRTFFINLIVNVVLGFVFATPRNNVSISFSPKKLNSFQKRKNSRASIVPVTKDSIHHEWKENPSVPASLIKSTSYGKLRGMIVSASLNRNVSAYLGIPYAKPPINELRFRAPQKVSPWTDIKDATRQPSSCYQRRDLFFADFEGVQEQEPRVDPSEDCLYLNVFVPSNLDSKQDNDNDQLSVIVYIHGGGFHSGSSLLKKGLKGEFRKSQWTSDPRELAAEGNVIVVTIQYRLSSFGFLFLDDEAAPGNVGLLDQYQAIEWVRNEIHNFGGNASSITVMGQEAGGISTLIHFAQNPNLFQRMILHSSGK